MSRCKYTKKCRKYEHLSRIRLGEILSNQTFSLPLGKRAASLDENQLFSDSSGIFCSKISLALRSCCW